MFESEKLYTIDIGDELGTKRPDEKPPTPPRRIARARAPQSVAPAPPAAVRKTRTAPRLHIALFVALTYLLGPFAILLSRRGRENVNWRYAGIASGSVGALLVLLRGPIMNHLDAGWALGPLFTVILAVVITGYSVWARAIRLAGETLIRNEKKNPEWMKSIWAIGGLGFLAPGLGLLLAGRARRASIVAWCWWPVAMAAVVMVHAGWIWQVRSASPLGVVSAETMELGFLALGGLLFTGLLGMSAQALDGIRVSPALAASGRSPRGDWYAVALLGAIATLAVVADPAAVAQRLDLQGYCLQQDGYRVLPLVLTQTAHKLNPAKSSYALKAIALNNELGRHEAAADLRATLDDNLDSYVTVVMNETRSPREVEQDIEAPAEIYVEPAHPAEMEKDPAVVHQPPSLFFGTMVPYGLPETEALDKHEPSAS